METKPTPGPWSYCCDKCIFVMSNHHPIARVERGKWGDDYPAIRPMDGGSLLGHYEVYMDQITYGEIDRGEAIANAHLIVAAPDLRDALKDMLSGWRYIREHHGDLYGVGWDRAEQKAVAALAKADGEPS